MNGNIFIEKFIYFAKCQDHVLFLHAITGCITISVFYRRFYNV